MTKRTKILLTISAVLVVLVLIFYIPSLFPEPVAEEAQPEFSVLSQEEQARLEEVRKIKNLSFDIGLFQDPIFKSLRDIPLPPAPTEPVGRPNPFLPY